MILGALIGAGSYTIAKNMFKKPQSSIKPKAQKEEDKQKTKEIREEILRKISGIQEEYLEKHSHRLMELVAQR